MFSLYQAIPGIDVGQFITDPPIALLIIFLAGSMVTVASGKVVIPRLFYDRVVAQLDKATEQVTELTKVVGEYNDELRELRRGNKS